MIRVLLDIRGAIDRAVAISIALLVTAASFVAVRDLLAAETSRWWPALCGATLLLIIARILLWLASRGCHAPWMPIGVVALASAAVLWVLRSVSTGVAPGDVVTLFTGERDRWMLALIGAGAALLVGGLALLPPECRLRGFAGWRVTLARSVPILVWSGYLGYLDVQWRLFFSRHHSDAALAVPLIGVALALIATTIILPGTLAAWRIRRWAYRRTSTVPDGAAPAIGCPGCGGMEPRSCGRCVCAACGASMTIRFEEPRCVCGQRLFGPAPWRCPECGRVSTIDAPDRVTTAAPA